MEWRGKNEPLRFIQISDLHLAGDLRVGLGWCDHCRGLDTEESLRTILDDIQIDEPSFDGLIVTGDIAQDGELSAYERFSKIMSQQGVPVYCLPGNHDHRGNMLRSLTGSTVTMPQYELRGRWLLLFLDSSCVGVDWGDISPSQLRWMELLLQAHSQYNVALFIHHHPVPTGSSWLDEIALRNGPEFLQLVENYPQVKLCVCGHIHQELDVTVGQMRVLGTPSTCLQFQPTTDQLQFSASPPAYRRLALAADGSIETAVLHSSRSRLSQIA